MLYILKPTQWIIQIELGRIMGNTDCPRACEA